MQECRILEFPSHSVKCNFLVFVDPARDEDVTCTEGADGTPMAIIDAKNLNDIPRLIEKAKRGFKQMHAIHYHEVKK